MVTCKEGKYESKRKEWCCRNIDSVHSQSSLLGTLLPGILGLPGYQP